MFFVQTLKEYIVVELFAKQKPMKELLIKLHMLMVAEELSELKHSIQKVELAMFIYVMAFIIYLMLLAMFKTFHMRY